MDHEESVPKDRYRYVYIVFYLLGIGNLMPWNFFINVQDYWDYKFRHVESGSYHLNLTDSKYSLNGTDLMQTYNETSGGLDPDSLHQKGLTPLQIKWNSYLSIASTIPQVVVLLINAVVGHKISISFKLLSSLVGIILLFILTDVMTNVNTDGFQHGFLILTLTTAVLVSCFIALLQGSLAGLAGLFPAEYMGSLFQGHAIGGIITAVLNIVSIASTGSKNKTSPSKSAFFCFLAATIFIAVDTFALISMTKTKFYKYYTGVRENKAKKLQPNNENEGLSESSTAYLEPSDTTVPSRNIDSDQNILQIKQMTSTTYNCTNGTYETPLIISETNPPRDTENHDVSPTTSTFYIISKIWVWIAVVFITFVVCLSVFPSIIALVDSTEKGNGYIWNDKYFTPVGCFLLFNIGDYIGIILASTFKWPKATRSGSFVLLIVSVLRLMYIPLFLFCNASPLNRQTTKVYINSDAIFLFLVATMSISNGYIGNIAMMFGPKMLDCPEEQSRAASILCFFLVLGVAVGALLSAPLLQLL